MIQAASHYNTKPIELAKFVIGDENAVIEARAKLYKLFALLGHDNFFTTYAATLFSDIARAMLDSSRSDAIAISVHAGETLSFVKFSISCPLPRALSQRLECLFDGFEVITVRGQKLCRAIIHLKDPILTQDMMINMREAVEFKRRWSFDYA